ncbi:MAG TPA: hypothetical protein VFQ45_02915, partial [Longimicrobium sp.]|nr:hypothetical protein [Longimicrobium sp.]
VLCEKPMTRHVAEAEAAAAAPGGFRPEDRRRLEKAVEMLSAGRDQMRRIADGVALVQEQTRWVAEQRARTDPTDGEPLWTCRGRGLAEQLQVQQRLVGQVLDDVRVIHQQNQGMMRRLRAMWRRLTRKRK